MIMAPPGYKGSGSYYNLQQFFEGNRPQALQMASDIAGYGDQYYNAANAQKMGGPDYDSPYSEQWGKLDTDGRSRVYESNLGKTGELGGLTQSFGGRQTLLRDALGNQGGAAYTPGMARLDSFLLGSDAGASKVLGDAGQRWSGLRSVIAGEEKAIADQNARDAEALKQPPPYGWTPSPSVNVWELPYKPKPPTTTPTIPYIPTPIRWK